MKIMISYSTFLHYGSHRSCLVLISWEKPKSIEFLEHRSGKVKSLMIKGLDNLAAKKIFIAEGFIGSESRLIELINLYQNNPLKLKIVAEIIQEVFNGNIVKFLEKATIDFDDIYELLNAHFERLSDLEKNIMYFIVNAEQAVSLDELRNKFPEGGSF